MYVNPSKFDRSATADLEINKIVRPFGYASTTQDLIDGDIVKFDWTASTFGYGQSVVISDAGGPTVNCIGPVDHAVDASADFTADPVERKIMVVVAGVKRGTNAIATGGCTAAGIYQMQSAATAGRHIDVTAGNEHCAFGISRSVGVDLTTKCVEGLYVLPRFVD